MIGGKGLLQSEERRKASLKAAIDALPKSSSKDSRRLVVDIPEKLYVKLRKVALAREITPTTYIRRAVYAMMAHDLHIPVARLFRDDPSVKRHTGSVIMDPRGTKYGLWEIDRLVDDDESAQG